ncbi:MAG: hypothetical protein U5L09_07205 [Bacteroidales bacterium]|nr:hypothetical protein [Bacteroidales bacterium]
MQRDSKTIPEGFARRWTLPLLRRAWAIRRTLRTSISPEGDSVIAVQWTFGDPGSGGANVSDQHNPRASCSARRALSVV